MTQIYGYNIPNGIPPNQVGPTAPVATPQNNNINPYMGSSYFDQAKMSKDFSDLWNGQSGVTNKTWGGGNITALGNGRARYTNAQGKTFDINSGMSYDQLAELDPSIAAELQGAYGYNPQTSPQKLFDLARQNAPQVTVDTTALTDLGNLAKQRYKQYDDTIRGYYDNPSSFKLNPAYQAMLERGTEAVNRSAAAKGMLGSGNRLYELQKYGSDLASQAWDSEIKNLSNLVNVHGGISNDAFGQAGQLQLGASTANANSVNNAVNALLSRQQISNQNDLALRSWDTQDRAARANAANQSIRTKADLLDSSGKMARSNFQDDLGWLKQLSALGKDGAGQVGAGAGGFGNDYQKYNIGKILSQIFEL